MSKEATFVYRLQIAREQNNLTQQELADKIRVARQSIGNYESGKKTPDFEIFIRLSDALGVSLEWLAGRDELPIRSDNDIRNITGLSDGAISTLKRWHERDKAFGTDTMRTINRILESEELLKAVDGYFELHAVDVTFTKKSRGITSEDTIPADKLEDAYLSDIRDTLKEVKQNGEH